MVEVGIHSYEDAYTSLLKYIKPQRILEWGPGLNTEIALDLGIKVVSIEHQNQWLYDKFNINHSPILTDLNSDFYIQKNEKLDYDLYFVDGRRRQEILVQIKNKATGSYLACLHDSQREKYQEYINLFKYKKELCEGFIVLSDFPYDLFFNLNGNFYMKNNFLNYGASKVHNKFTNTYPCIIHNCRNYYWKDWEKLKNEVFSSEIKYKNNDELAIVTWSNFKHETLIEKNCKHLGIDIDIIGKNEINWVNSLKIKLLYDYLCNINKKYFLAIDAEDCLIINDPSYILTKFKNEYNCDLLFASELNSFPRINNSFERRGAVRLW
jgi:hypothetical protein